MRRFWPNTVLLALVAFEGITGLYGLVSGAPDRAFLNDLHALGGWAIVLVMVWKVGIILRALRRPSGLAKRYASLFTLALLGIVLGLGFIWSSFGWWSVWGVSGVSLHIWLGAALVPLVAWHALQYTRVLRTGYSTDRRVTLRLAGGLAVGAGVWAVTESALKAFSLPGAERRFTGAYERGSFQGNDFPRVSWLNDSPEPIDPSRWTLTIDGAVDRSLSLTIRDFDSEGSELPSTEITGTVDCTGGWYSTHLWRGVPVADLLAMAGVRDGARSVTFTSVTGYYRRASLSDVRNYLLATHVDGESLSHGHGAPVRLVATGRRGYEWVKWVTVITVNTTTKWRQPPLPLQ